MILGGALPEVRRSILQSFRKLSDVLADYLQVEIVCSHTIQECWSRGSLSWRKDCIVVSIRFASDYVHSQMRLPFVHCISKEETIILR